LTSAIRSRRSTSTTDTEHESGIEVSPTFAANQDVTSGVEREPTRGLVFTSNRGENTVSVFSIAAIRGGDAILTKNISSANIAGAQ